MRRVAVVFGIVVFTGSSVWGQTSDGTNPELDAILIPGTTVWITDAAGRENKRRILEVSGSTVTAVAGEDVLRLRAEEIRRIRVRRSDPVWNGALIGAGSAVATGLFLCRMMEPWENCRDDIGAMVQIGAIGAGIGIGVDALVRGRKTVYEAPRTSMSVHAAPIITPRSRGLQVSITF